MTGSELSVIVLVGLALLLQGAAGWLSFVAYYDENLTRTGNKETSRELHGSVISWLFVRWDGDRGLKLAFRLTQKWFGIASRTETPQGEPDLDYVNAGCRIGARGFRFISFVLAGVAFYVALILEVPIVRLTG